jgi:hypothetical protein
MEHHFLFSSKIRGISKSQSDYLGALPKCCGEHQSSRKQFGIVVKEQVQQSKVKRSQIQNLTAKIGYRPRAQFIRG